MYLACTNTAYGMLNKSFVLKVWLSNLNITIGKIEDGQSRVPCYIQRSMKTLFGRESYYDFFK